MTFTPEEEIEIKQAVGSILPLGLTVEVCGSWVWVSGETRQHKESLKEHGFRWAPKKKVWYFKPSTCKGFFKGNTPMDDIKRKYGAVKIRSKA